MPCPPTDSPLRRFISLPGEALLILGPRRLPALRIPASNSATAIGVSTTVGNRQLEILKFAEFAKALRPDIILPIADIEFGKNPPGLKRKDKMDERTQAWLRGQRNLLAPGDGELPTTSLWAPILPVEPELQQTTLEYLEESPDEAFGGLALYSNESLMAIPKSKQHLPRLMLTELQTPQDILTAIELGADLLTIPFITATSEAGLALDFCFPSPESPSPLATSDQSHPRRSLAFDLHVASNITDLSPLVPRCLCYACSMSHRAYIHHLLAAKEMLAWVLLQIHNHHVISEFFAGIRRSIAAHTFEEDAQRFRDKHQSEFPEPSGEGPRLRGYMKRDKPKPGGTNKAPWGKIGEEKERESKPKVVDDRSEKTAESKETGLFNVLDEHDLEQLGVVHLYESHEEHKEKQ